MLQRRDAVVIGSLKKGGIQVRHCEPTNGARRRPLSEAIQGAVHGAPECLSQELSQWRTLTLLLIAASGRRFTDEP
jgi:hypothetical protein